MAYAPFLSFVILLLSTLSAYALESDRNQSVLVEADEVEIVVDAVKTGGDNVEQENSSVPGNGQDDALSDADDADNDVDV